MKDILNIGLRIILNALILLLLTMIVTILVYFYNEKKSVETGKYHQPLFSAHLIVSESMLDKINVNDVVINRYIKPKDVTVGDIITFRSPGDITKNYTHRVIGIIEVDGVYYYKTKGDNNYNVDKLLVSDDLLIGKVMFLIPLLGYIYLFINSYLGISAMIILFLGTFVSARLFFDIVDTFNKKRTKELEDEV